jgi:hypothetical protein
MTSAKLLRAHAGLLASLDLEIEQASDPELCETSAPGISKWSVKDHLEHLLIAHGGIVGWIERARDGDPELDMGGRPRLVGRIVLLVGAFPRGRAKAPERTRPTGTSAEELAARSYGIRERVEELEGSLARLQASHATRNHFVFGDLNAVQWLQFAVIHHNHHQKIIRDVLKVRSDRSTKGAVE